MFCDRCGKNNPDGMAFCEACGNPLGETIETGAGESSKTAKLIASIVALAVAALLLIWGVINLVGCIQTGASGKSIKEFYKAIKKDEYGEIIEQMPKEFKDIAKENKDAIKEDLKSKKKASKKEYGSDYKLSYSIIDYIDYTDDEVEDIEDGMNSMLGDDDVKVEDARQYMIKVKEKGSKKKTETYEFVTVVKIDGEWYMSDVLGMATSYGYYGYEDYEDYE